MEETGKAQSKPAAIESFSYSWLNSFPSSENLTDAFDDSSSSSYIEMDPTSPPSRRFSEISFKFDSPVSRHTLFHADELFRDGHVMPFFASVGSNTDDPVRPASKERESSRRFRRLPVGVLLKSLDFFRRMFGGGGRQRRRRRKGKNGNFKGRVHSEETSRRISVDCRRRSCDSESSIYEAVLHCKKSFGN